MTDRRTCLGETGDKVAKLNQKLKGWANYFCLGPVVRVYEVVMKHVRRRLRRWLCAKHKVTWPGTKAFPEASLYDALGLVRLPGLTADLPWANA